MPKYGFLIKLLSISLICSLSRLITCSSPSYADQLAQDLLKEDVVYTDNRSVIPLGVREYWMREANQALFTLQGPCPFQAFGSVIVNHSAPGENGLGDLICIGANNNSMTGNPTLHGKQDKSG